MVLHTGKMQMHVWTNTYINGIPKEKIIGKATHQTVNSDYLWESIWGVDAEGKLFASPWRSTGTFAGNPELLWDKEKRMRLGRWTCVLYFPGEENRRGWQGSLSKVTWWVWRAELLAPSLELFPTPSGVCGLYEATFPLNRGTLITTRLPGASVPQRPGAGCYFWCWLAWGLGQVNLFLLSFWFLTCNVGTTTTFLMEMLWAPTLIPFLLSKRYLFPVPSFLRGMPLLEKLRDNVV